MNQPSPVSFRVRNWAKFQHYRDRNPPWIKLHWSLISSRDWVCLDDASRVLALACMLLASRNEDDPGSVPNDPEYVRRVAYLNGAPDFNPLIKCGFLEPASTALAECLQDARRETETETEAEVETEREGAQPKRARSPNGSRLARDWKLPDEWRNWANGGSGAFAVDVDAEAEKFADYWHSVAGAKGRKADWQATWRNWIRRSLENGRVNGKRFETAQDRFDAADAKARLTPSGQADSSDASVVATVERVLRI